MSDSVPVAAHCGKETTEHDAQTPSITNAMIDKTKIIETVFARLDALPVEHYLDIRTYKRNRSVIIVKKADDRLSVIQDGYEQNTYEISRDQLKKLLKMLLKKEFPRSIKVRLYTMGRYSPEAVSEEKRKII